MGFGKRYDVVIVGGGTAGCALAARLSEDPSRSVLVLEAGADYPDMASLPEALKNGNNAAFAVMSGDTWWYAGVPNAAQSDALVTFPRGKVVGGTGAIDGRIHLWGLPEDYDAWAAAGCDGWRFEDVHPFLQRMERDLDFPGGVHGNAGPLPISRHKRTSLRPLQEAFVEACVSAGFPEDRDMNHPDSPGGVGFWPFAVVDGTRINTATAYVGPARGRANLTIAGGVQVRRLLVERGEVIGVEAVRGDETFRVEAGEVALCAGSFASPHLLMVSGIGPADHLRQYAIPVLHDLPGVGANLRDHPLVNLVFKSSERSPDDRAPVLQAGLRMTATGSKERLDLHFLPFSPVSAAASQYGFMGQESFVGTNLAVSLRAPKGYGRVRLSSADPMVQPTLEFNFLDDEWDLARMREGVRLAIELSRQPGYRAQVLERITPDDETVGSDEALSHWLRSSVTAAHAVGTCRIGPAGDPMAVLDARCRVRGVNGLWVADGSSLPNIVRANTAAAATLIAERVSHWIRNPRNAS